MSDQEDGEKNYPSSTSEPSSAAGDGRFPIVVSVSRDGDEPVAIPPRFSVLRVNTLHFSVPEVHAHVERYLKQLNDAEHYTVVRHSLMRELLIIAADQATPPASHVTADHRQLIVDALCGASVLRGGDVFTPGVIGLAAGVCAGDEVSVLADLDGRCLRGSTQHYRGRTQFVGNGRMLVSRDEIFCSAKTSRGVAVCITHRLFANPSLATLCEPGAVGAAGKSHLAALFLQNLPSALVAHVLRPRRTHLVLDMCAAPGGKASHLAQMIDNSGIVYAFDRSRARLAKLERIISQLGVTCVRAACVANSASALFSPQSRCTLRQRHMTMSGGSEDPGCAEHGYAECAPPFAAGTFDRVLVDAPCSGRGQRPRLVVPPGGESANYVLIQRRLLTAAAALTAPSSGCLVYSTCTLTVEENEHQVAALLACSTVDGHQMSLVDAIPRLAAGGRQCPGLTEEQARLVQRFTGCPPRADLATCDNDTIGFFIAKFAKH